MMAPHDRRPRRRLWPLVYLAGWLAAGAAIAVLVVSLLGGVDRQRATEEVSAPIDTPDLDMASRRAGCRLLKLADERPAEPSSEGPAGEPAQPGVHEQALARSAAIGAVRRGIVVLNYRPGLSEGERAELEALQQTIPEGILVAPNPRLRDAVAAAAWQHVLLCPRPEPDVLDALRLFVGRYLGTGPESS